MFSTSLGMVGSKNVSDRHTMSKLLFAINAFTNGILIQSWAASPVKLQWQNVILGDLFGPGLTSISPNNKSRRCLRLLIKYMIANT